MTSIDYSIVVVYLGLMIGVGVYFQRKASSGIDSYFLGNKKLPWWVLGASGMASNLDVSGTMVNVSLIYVLGAQGFFVEIRGGIVLIMAFLMVFMGKWNQRANVMTMAEWMELRFGSGRQGNAARLIAAIATIITTIWIITYFAFGAGKFIGEFLGLPEMLGMPPDFWAAALMIVLAMIYTVTSGLYGVVWTDVFQGFLIFATILIICFIAFTQFVLPESFSISVPLIDKGYTSITATREQWTSIWPDWNLNMPENSRYSVFNLFGITISFYLIKTVIDGSAGTGGYMIQRFFAARSGREAGLLSLFWTFLLAFRWPFIAAIAIMGIAYAANNGQAVMDPEKVLPIVINNLVPVGVKGLLVAGLMAAAMSTFDSLVNAGASYWVKDIYQKFINNKASEKQLITQSRLASVLMVVFGLFLTLNVRNLNDIWSWLTMGIGAGMLVPLLIRWYWWRLNGYGFASGIGAGMITAIIIKIALPDLPEYAAFSIISLIALAASIAGTLLTPAVDEQTLLNFYKITKPFGIWKAVRGKIDPAENKKTGKENKRDIAAVFFAVPWQLTLFLTMMVIVLKRWDLFAVLLNLLLVLSAGLYYFWYRHLSEEK